MLGLLLGSLVGSLAVDRVPGVADSDDMLPI
jgi:hypothetical protein